MQWIHQLDGPASLLSQRVFTDPTIHEGAVLGLWSHCRTLLRKHGHQQLAVSAYPEFNVVSVFVSHLLKTQHCCLCPNGRLLHICTISAKEIGHVHIARLLQILRKLLLDLIANSGVYDQVYSVQGRI